MTEETSPETPAPDEKRCRCGYTKSHPRVQPSPSYSLTGWFFLIMGASVTPTEVEYRCARCNMSFGKTTDPEVLKKIS